MLTGVKVVIKDIKNKNCFLNFNNNKKCASKVLNF